MENSFDNSPIPRAPLPRASSDRDYNRLVDSVSDLTRTLSSSYGLSTGDPFIPEVFFGFVSDPPTDDDDDYPDARYWIQRGVSLGGNDPTDQLVVESDTVARGASESIVTASNLAELPVQTDDGTYSGHGTHLLDLYQPVIVFGIPNRWNPVKKNYSFVSIPLRSVTVRISSAATGKGKYNGKIVKAPVADISASTDLADTMFGADGEDVLICNSQEANKLTGPAHDIDPAAYPRTFVGHHVYTNSDGTKVIAITARQTEDCS